MCTSVEFYWYLLLFLFPLKEINKLLLLAFFIQNALFSLAMLTWNSLESEEKE